MNSSCEENSDQLPVFAQHVDTIRCNVAACGSHPGKASRKEDSTKSQSSTTFGIVARWAILDHNCLVKSTTNPPKTRPSVLEHRFTSPRWENLRPECSLSARSVDAECHHGCDPSDFEACQASLAMTLRAICSGSKP